MMRAIALAVAASLLASSAFANPRVDRLLEAMQVPTFLVILREEGQEQGDTINEGLLDGAGGSLFQEQVDLLYDPAWMYEQLSDAVEVGMDDGQLEQAAIFFESDLGQTIVSLENSARRALGDDAIEEFARLNYAETDRSTPFFRLLDEYIEVNDLVDRNLQGTLSADYNFYRGLSSGQGLPVDDQSILSELLEGQDEARQETIDWMYSFLLLAYKPLSEVQLRENIAFSRTDTGQALNKALFEGFDQMIDTISYELGAVVAHALRSSDL